VEATHRASAEGLRAPLLAMQVTPARFRAALLAVPPAERDAWVDAVFELNGLPDDGPALPRGCVPYLPCAVDPILRMIDSAGVQAADVFVDVGAGIGRAALLVHLLTGAAAIGLEIQPALVHISRELTRRLGAPRYAVIEGDAVRLAGAITTATVFFLYCPFSGARLERLLDELEPIARTRPIRICTVDLPLPPRPWLTLLSPPHEDLAVYRSTLLAAPQ